MSSSFNFIDEIFNMIEQQVKIPVEKGGLGLTLDDDLEAYKKQVIGGKSWDEMSKQLNTLAIFNKDRHPDVADKARHKREELAAWVDKKRESNPDFGK